MEAENRMASVAGEIAQEDDFGYVDDAERAVHAERGAGDAHAQRVVLHTWPDHNVASTCGRGCQTRGTHTRTHTYSSRNEQSSLRQAGTTFITVSCSLRITCLESPPQARNQISGPITICALCFALHHKSRRDLARRQFRPSRSSLGLSIFPFLRSAFPHAPCSSPDLADTPSPQTRHTSMPALSAAPVGK